MISNSPVAVAARRDRRVTVLGVIALTGLAWLYTIHLARQMETMTMPLAAPRRWDVVDLALLAVMWIVMMVAMMLPSASPMLLLYTKTLNARLGEAAILPRSALFVGGYLAAWTGFSLVAAALQWELHAAALLSPMMVSTHALLGSGLLIAAGVYQWTPLKQSCLRRCRSPLGFLLTEWREGATGAFVMGLRHGLFCVGCCWALMALLFVTGVMNLVWVAAIAVFVLIEKIAPAGAWIARGSGAMMIAYGLLLLLEPGVA
jgi:predicted metal-binding membrane protein